MSRFVYRTSDGREVQVEDLEDLGRLIRSGEITPDTLLHDASTDRWLRAGDTPLFRFLLEDTREGASGEAEDVGGEEAPGDDEIAGEAGGAGRRESVGDEARGEEDAGGQDEADDSPDRAFADLELPPDDPRPGGASDPMGDAFADLELADLPDPAEMEEDGPAAPGETGPTADFPPDEEGPEGPEASDPGDDAQDDARALRPFDDGPWEPAPPPEPEPDPGEGAEPAPLRGHSPFIDPSEFEAGGPSASGEAEEDPSGTPAPPSEGRPGSWGPPGGGPSTAPPGAAPSPAPEPRGEPTRSTHPVRRRSGRRPRRSPTRRRPRRRGAATAAVLVLALAAGGGYLFLAGSGQEADAPTPSDDPPSADGLTADAEPGDGDMVPVAEDVPPELEGTEERLRESVAGILMARLESLRSEHGLAEALSPDWLSGRYFASAGDFPEVREYWEQYGAFLAEVRRSDEGLFRESVETALGEMALSEEDEEILHAHLLEAFRAAEPRRAERYRELEELAEASVALHDLLAAHAADIAYTPAFGRTVTGDPVLEAVPGDPELREEINRHLDRMLHALDRSQGIQPVSTPLLMEALYERLFGG